MITLESYINNIDRLDILDGYSLDNGTAMIVANEGIVGDIGASILKAIKFVWGKFLDLLRTVKTKVKEFFSKKESKKDLKASNEELKKQIQQNNEKIKELQNQLKESTDKHSELNDKYNKIKDENNKLQNKNKELNKELLTSSLDFDASQSTNRDLRDQKMNLVREVNALNAKNKELTERLKSADNDKHLADVKKAVDGSYNKFMSACNNLSNAIKYGVTNHFKEASYDIQELSKLHGPADFYNWKEKNKYDIALKSWLDLRNSRPGIHLDNAKEQLKQAQECIKDIEIDFDALKLLRIAVSKQLKEIDDLAKQMETGKKQLESMISMANSFKDKNIKKYILSGLNGCNNDWATIMSVVSHATQVGTELCRA